MSSYIPGLGLGLDWIAHFLQFAVLMIWFGGILSAPRHPYVAAALILLGALIEIVQATNIFRHFDLLDIVANTLGVIAGLMLVRTWLRDWCYRMEAKFAGQRV
ncbi:MAG: VanZ family protein [Gammaproteobacteria bacterium]|nr:VanZ family protein [Gammaproteobacteria bacterium]MDH3768533.1 VanZ family protein [Gammaproteobacteria bacterium]